MNSTEGGKAFSDERESERVNEVGKDEDLENIPENEVIDDMYSDSDSDSECYYTDGSKSEDFYKRLHRKEVVQHFTDRYKFEPGQKFCIHPYGLPISCLSDKCFDSTWVGVYGMQSICIVIPRDMDMTRLHAGYQKDCLKHHNMRMFAKAAISEIECLPHEDVDYYDVAFRRSCTGTVKKPFAVVSLGLGTLKESGYEGSKLARCVGVTSRFLESAVSSDSLDTHYGIIRVAIKAYELMWDKELKADDIWVTILNVKSGLFDHLPADIVGEQLDFVNGSSDEENPQKPLFVYRGDLLLI